MKKLMAFLVICALVAGSVFAVDLGGEVISGYTLVSADNVKDSDATSGGFIKRLRLQGEGENGDGTFGAWMRWDIDGPAVNEGNGTDYAAANAWWKPIDQLKIRFGSNGGDGFWGKEGWTGWMFHQRVNETSVVGDDNAWGWNPYAFAPVIGWTDFGLIKMRNAFYGGYGDNRLALEITPIDVLSINIGLPFTGWQAKGNDKTMHDDLTAGLFLNMVAQIDVNLDFGNIAFTMDLQGKDADDKIHGEMFFYFGLRAIDNVDIDIGFGMPFSGTDEKYQMAFGLGAKIGISDEFAIKLRTVAKFGGEEWDPFLLLFDVQPQFAISDNVKVLADIGLSMIGSNDKAVGELWEKDSVVGFHFNPYIWIGEEWGPSFFAGVKVYADGTKWGPDDDKTKIQFEVPIGIAVGF